MEIEVGKCYYHKVGLMASVRKVLAVTDGNVEYETLYGPMLKKQRHGKQRLRGFRRWAHDLVDEKDDYKYLDGCIIWETYIVRNTQGQPIFRCGGKRAKFYLRKGYTFEVEPGVLQFTNDVTENRLSELYNNELTDFFMEVKNDRCVCCGEKHGLTRHHVVPSRNIKVMPQPYRSCISNILFLCIKCHWKYEKYIVDNGEPNILLGNDPLQYAREWRDHFLAIMQPLYLPKGWDIVTVKNLEAAGKYNNGPEPAGEGNAGDCQAESA